MWNFAYSSATVSNQMPSFRRLIAAVALVAAACGGRAEAGDDTAPTAAHNEDPTMSSSYAGVAARPTTILIPDDSDLGTAVVAAAAEDLLDYARWIDENAVDSDGGTVAFTDDLVLDFSAAPFDRLTVLGNLTIGDDPGQTLQVNSGFRFGEPGLFEDTVQFNGTNVIFGNMGGAGSDPDVLIEAGGSLTNDGTLDQGGAATFDGTTQFNGTVTLDAVMANAGDGHNRLRAPSITTDGGSYSIQTSDVIIMPAAAGAAHAITINDTAAEDGDVIHVTNLNTTHFLNISGIITTSLKSLSGSNRSMTLIRTGGAWVAMHISAVP